MQRIERRTVATVVVLAMTVGMAVLLPAAPASPAPREVADASRLPALPSEVGGPEASASHAVDTTILPPPTPSEAPRPPEDGDRRPVVELIERRKANAEIWRNDDGTETMRLFDSPKYYQEPGGTWVPIRTEIVDDSADGIVELDAGPFIAEFPTLGRRSPAAVTVSTPGGRAVGFEPLAEADEVVPQVVKEDGRQVVRYADVWRGVDIEYIVTASGVKEDIVIKAHGGRSTFPFRLHGQQLHPDPTADSALTTEPAQAPGHETVRLATPIVVSGDGKMADAEAAPSMRVAPGASVANDATTKVVAGHDRVLELALDPSWLDTAVLPVRLDPTVTVGPSWSTAWSSLGDRCDNVCSIRAGNSSPPPNGEMYWRSVAQFPYESLIDNQQVVLDADLRVTRTYGTTEPYFVDVFWATANSYEGAVNHDHVVGSAEWTNSHTYDVTASYRDWVASGTRNVALGFAGEYDPWWYSYKQFNAALDITYSTPPPTTSPVSPAADAVVTTTTPTFEAAAVADPDGDTVFYYHRVATSPDAETGAVINSGWSTSPQWTVPVGTFEDGRTYWWHTYTTDGHAMRSPSAVRRVSVDLRFGTSHVSPMDAVGPVSVNLATGNAVVQVGTQSVQTVGGPLGLTFTYNSRQPRSYGLTGRYYWDANANRAFDASDPLSFQRKDPLISFDWGTGSPGPSAASDNMLVRWEGLLTVPSAGTWEIGAINDDGVRVWVDGQLVLGDWADQTAGPAQYGTGVSFPAGSLTKSIKVEYYEASGGSVIRLQARKPGDVAYPGGDVPSSWFSDGTSPLPPRWTLSAGGASTLWQSARIAESAVTLISADGSAWEFKKTTGAQPGWEPPPDVADVLTVDAGWVTVNSGHGLVYSFDPDGRLHSVRSAGDDREPAAVEYVWEGDRLTSLRDPVSQRLVTLHYGGDPACPSPTVAGLIGAPDGFICRVAFWDGTATHLWYANATDPKLARIERFVSSSGNGTPEVTDFGYGSNDKMSSIRSPLAADAVAAGVRADDSNARTEISYHASGASAFRVASVTLPKALPGDSARPGRTYRYGPDGVGPNGQPLPADTVDVHVNGLGSGFERRVVLDANGRTFSDTDAAGSQVRYAYDEDDRMTARRHVNTTLRETFAYDDAGRLVTHHGPAYADYYTGNAPKAEYAQAVPTETTAYDEGIPGLAAEYYDRANFGSPPVLHETGVGSADGSVNASWGSTIKAGNDADWGLRLTGEIQLDAVGTYTFWTWARGGTRVYVDDIYVTGDINAESVDSARSELGSFNNTRVGKHRIRIDFAQRSGEASLELFWAPPGGNAALVPGSKLSPGYGLVTTTVEAGGRRDTFAYEDANRGIRPALGLPTRVTEAAGTPEAVTTSYVYEDPRVGGWLRRTQRTLPGGNWANRTYYLATQSQGLSTCGLPATNQGGLQRLYRLPDPDGSASQVRVDRQVVHDAAGRVVGERVGSEAWSCTSYDVRGRPTQQTFPAYGGQAARTVTWSWAVAPGQGATPNPLVNSVADASGTVTTTLDLLGRPISQTDALGRTTTTTYDLAGRPTQVAMSGLQPLGRTYDDAGRLTSVRWGNACLSDISYDPNTTRLASVEHPADIGMCGGSEVPGGGNSTRGLFTYDPRGAVDSVQWLRDVIPLHHHTVARSSSGRILSETVDGFDPVAGEGAAGWNYRYDARKRLIKASVPVGNGAWNEISYGYGDTTSATCPQSSARQTAGKNTNRTSMTTVHHPASGAPQQQGTLTYCYDSADRLIASSDPDLGTISYDSHGNTTQIFGETRTYDVADRHMSTTKGGSTVAYTRDALDRVIRRSSPTGTIEYGYSGDGGISLVTQGSTTTAIVSLPGGVVVSIGSTTANRTWSYPNVRGDIAVTAGQDGELSGGPFRYDPFGEPQASPAASNLPGPRDLGFLGQHGIQTDAEPGFEPVVEMGVRGYSPRLGRFLEVDPVEGGTTTNDYGYVPDPLIQLDLTGEGICDYGRAASLLPDHAGQVANRASAYAMSRGLRGVGRLFSGLARTLSVIATGIDFYCRGLAGSGGAISLDRHYDPSQGGVVHKQSGSPSPYQDNCGVPLTPGRYYANETNEAVCGGGAVQGNSRGHVGGSGRSPKTQRGPLPTYTG